jgi:hypothetical protein
VELAVYPDEAAFDVFAEIVATVPGSGDDAQVRVTYDGESGPALLLLILSCLTPSETCSRGSPSRRGG